MESLFISQILFLDAVLLRLTHQSISPLFALISLVEAI